MKIDILKKIQKESYLERGRQAIKFVEDHLDPDSVDEPWLRSSYILMSFGFEIILKSRVIALSHASNKLELDQELIKIGHNFISLFEVLGEKELKHIGLKKDIIKEPYNNYNYFVIETINDKSIKIENFNDIRYGGNFPKTDSDEHKKIIRYAKLILEVSEKIKNANRDPQA